MVGESPLCLSAHSSSVSFHRCCHCLVNDRAHMLLGSRLICFVLSVIARFVKASAGLQWLARSETLSEISPHHRVDTISFIIHTCSSYAFAQSHEHGEHRLLHRPIKIHSGSGAKCLCDYIVRDGDCRADAGGTSATTAATSNADSAYHDAGNTVTNRIRPSSDS